MPQRLDEDGRREFLGLWAWLPFSRAERFQIVAAVLGFEEDMLREIVRQDPTLAEDMDTASRAAVAVMYGKLDEAAKTNGKASRFRDRIAPIIRENPAL
jgi:hypothetical protein